MPDGLGNDGDALVDELKHSVGRILLLSTSPAAQASGADMLDAADEAGLLGRVEAALRPVPETDATDAVLRFAQYRLDLAGRSLVDASGAEVTLTRSEFDLLQAFAQRPGRVLSRDQLMQALAGRDTEAFDRSIDMLIVRLRRKIEADPKNPSLILTVPGSGYKFAAKVQAAEAIVEAAPTPAARAAGGGDRDAPASRAPQRTGRPGSPVWRRPVPSRPLRSSPGRAPRRRRPSRRPARRRSRPCRCPESPRSRCCRSSMSAAMPGRSAWPTASPKT